MMNEYEYTQEEFDEQYFLIKSYLTSGKIAAENTNTILINGQPGVGKSNYEAGLSENSIIIDTDEFRRFHPRIDSINKLDAENYAERTQPFANAITEKLISELAKEKYNLVIEGTLRTAEVPINTCEKLKKNGHEVNLVVVACDACLAWESTIIRAKQMMQNGRKPRLVPIDKYDYNVQHIVNNLKTIRKKDCFHSISVVERNGKPISLQGKTPEQALSEVLNLDKWNKNKEKYEINYLKNKMEIIKQELKGYDI